MIGGTRLRLLRPSHITKVAIAASFATITWSAAFLLVLYPRLPWLLAVHFKPNGFPNGWQYKTYWRVLMPVFVQLSLTLVLLACALPDLFPGGRQVMQAAVSYDRLDAIRGPTPGPLISRFSVERTTGFEPATPTLARLCSTN